VKSPPLSAQALAALLSLKVWSRPEVTVKRIVIDMIFSLSYFSMKDN
jgi:hypothetical protein